MKNALLTIKSPALISLLLTLPSIILELIDRRTFNEGFPFLLFGILWLLQTAFIIFLMPAIKNFQAGNKLMFLLQIGSLLSISFLWLAIIQDQLPCFLGTPNCD